MSVAAFFTFAVAQLAAAIINNNHTPSKEERKRGKKPMRLMVVFIECVYRFVFSMS